MNDAQHTLTIGDMFIDIGDVGLSAADTSASESCSSVTHSTHNTVCFHTDVENDGVKILVPGTDRHNMKQFAIWLQRRLKTHFLRVPLGSGHCDVLSDLHVGDVYKCSV